MRAEACANLDAAWEESTLHVLDHFAAAGLQTAKTHRKVAPCAERPPAPPTGPATGFSRGVSYVYFQQVARNQGQHAYSSSIILNAVFGEHLARNAQGPDDSTIRACMVSPRGRESEPQQTTSLPALPPPPKNIEYV